jgi:hypothetical protein
MFRFRTRRPTRKWGSEDEENNYYSTGDNHNDLDEDKII